MRQGRDSRRRLIGHGGLNPDAGIQTDRVLWALHPDTWGKGYATEVWRRAALRLRLQRRST